MSQIFHLIGFVVCVIIIISFLRNIGSYSDDLEKKKTAFQAEEDQKKLVSLKDKDTLIKAQKSAAICKRFILKSVHKLNRKQCRETASEYLDYILNQPTSIMFREDFSKGSLFDYKGYCDYIIGAQKNMIGLKNLCTRKLFKEIITTDQEICHMSDDLSYMETQLCDQVID